MEKFPASPNYVSSFNINNEQRWVSPVFPTVPVVVSDHEERFLSVPKGGIPALVPLLDTETICGKISVGKGILFPLGFALSTDLPAYAPCFIGDEWLMCRRLIKGEVSRDISLVNVSSGLIITKKGLLYDYVVPTQSGEMLMLGAKSIALTHPKQLMALVGAKYSVIYKRQDNQLYPSGLNYVPLRALSENLIATIAPDKKAFELIEKKEECWNLRSVVKTENELSGSLVWGNKRACAVSFGADCVEFHDLENENGSSALIRYPGISAPAVFLKGSLQLICSLKTASALPSIILIECSDFKNPSIISVESAPAESCDTALASYDIEKMVVLGEHLLLKSKAGKSYAFGPLTAAWCSGELRK